MNQADLDAMFQRTYTPVATETPITDEPPTDTPPADAPPVVDPVVLTEPVTAEPVAPIADVEPVVGDDDDPKFEPVGFMDIFGDAPAQQVAPATQEPPVSPTQQTQQAAPPVDAELLALLKAKLGVEANDLASAKTALEQYKAPKISGYDEKVSAAIINGDITIEELAANKVHDLSVLPIDDAATYHLMELGLGIEEAQQHVEGLDETTKKIYAATWTKEQQRSREAILQQAKAQRDQRMIEQEAKRNEFKSEVIATSRAITPETININGYKPAQAETAQVARAMEAIADDPQKALSLVLGKNPNDLARNLTLLLYPEKIQEEAFKRGRNKATATTIREAQNPNVVARTGIPPTATQKGKFDWSTNDLIGHKS